jgi:putative DNA topoisomerase
MKYLTILVIAVTASLVTFGQTGKDTIPKASAQIEYYCGMHPDYTSDEPGKCPECNMDLLERRIDQKKSYNCPVHTDVVSDKPGKCSKCGKELVEKKAAAKKKG